MVTDWTDNPLATMSLYPSFSSWKGVPMLLMRRLTSKYHLDIVAEVDGPVRNAVMRITTPDETPSRAGCVAQLEDLNEGRWVLRVRGHGPLGDFLASPHTGGIGGRVGVLEPTVLAHDTDSRTYSFAISDNWVMRVGVPGSIVKVFPWSLSPAIHIVSPADDPENFKAGQFEVSGDAVFWSTATTFAHGINVWTPTDGTKPFVRYVGDYTRGAADLATDGTDLVWSQGEGKKSNQFVYPTRSIMTAPFTSDPRKLQPRRLRSAPYTNIGSFKWVVGCGYAAHTGARNGMMVVRLSDGTAWFIGEITSDFALSAPLGLTCEEVFFLGRFAGRTSIARVRLDSLGAGTPPD